MVDKSQLARDLQSIEGQAAASPVRSHGSMFVLDLGKLSKKPGDLRAHGEWCFIFEQAKWSFHNKHEAIISSTDDPRRIDETFSRLNLLAVTDASWFQRNVQRRGLRIDFANGVTLRATLNSDPDIRSEDQWIFFTPFRRVWTAKFDDIELERD